ncbi:MAG: hypothetical protein KDK65_03575 [Chlamydiia bacterium]|nr:hypothetical protein [Chlamydiia bacterium]
MELFLTTFVFILFALSILGIGWLLTGKTGIRPGGCGRFSEKNDQCGKEHKCQLCDDDEVQ